VQECRGCPHDKSARRVELPSGGRVRALACAECPWLTENRPPREPFSLESFLEGVAPAGPAPEPRENFEAPRALWSESDERDPAPESVEPQPFPCASDRRTALWRALVCAPFGLVLVLLRVDGWVALTGVLTYGSFGALSALLGPAFERERSRRTSLGGVGLACLGGWVLATVVLGVLSARGARRLLPAEGLGAVSPALEIAVSGLVVGLVLASALVGGEFALRRRGEDSDFPERLTVLLLAGLTWLLATLFWGDLAHGARSGAAAWALAWSASAWWPGACRKIESWAQARGSGPEPWWLTPPGAGTSSGDERRGQGGPLAPAQILARLLTRCAFAGVVWLCAVLAVERSTASAASQVSSLALLIGVNSLVELWALRRVKGFARLAALTGVGSALAICLALLNSHYMLGTWSGGLLAGVEELSTALEPGAWEKALLPATLLWGPLWLSSVLRAAEELEPSQPFAIIVIHLLVWVGVVSQLRGHGYVTAIVLLGFTDLLLTGVLFWVCEFADQVTLRAGELWTREQEPEG
jgi:hypothetical protein